MKFNLIVSSIALVAATSFGAMPAFAQSINGVAIPADQLETYVQYCETLVTAEADSALSTETTTDDDSEDSAVDPTTAGVGANANLVVDLATLDAAACESSGILGASATTTGNAMAPADNSAMNAEMTDVTINGVTLSGEDLVAVRAHCEGLGATDSSLATESTTPTDDSDSDGDSLSIAGLDLGTVTVEVCTEAGLM